MNTKSNDDEPMIDEGENENDSNEVTEEIPVEN